MRISAKGRYALAAMIDIARNAKADDCITVISIAERLGISKIYLEQVFSLLKKGGLVHSVKGAQGGYQLARTPQHISAYDVLSEVEYSLFENTGETVAKEAPEIDTAMKTLVFDGLDAAAENALKLVTLDDLVSESEKNNLGGSYMFYI